ncbi:LysR substrate-binding domain-containing protein [Xanthobacter autotrophicus DSM 431]|uniref:LysR substrate-binding domain-containing protein n=1 Tax=Xanthobacter nonsaccharivorans TaxID=3119912 RepID=UPI003728E60B
MDTKQLKYFVAIVECGGFARASRQLFIAQPALSQQIARLEQEVGAPLLIRSARGVSPTANGYALFRHAKFILRQLDHAVALARQNTAEITGRVAVGIAPTTACQVGMPFLERIQEKYPGVTLNIVEGLSGHLQHMAASGQLDIAILFTPNAVPDWQCTPLLDEELFVILPCNSPLFPRGRDTITLQEVADLPLVLPSRGHGLRRRIELEYERINVSLVPVAEIDSLPLLMSALAMGMGATIKPLAAIHVHGAAQAKSWRHLRISDAAISRPNYVFSLPAERMTDAVARIHGELLELVRDLVRRARWQGVELVEEAAPEAREPRRLAVPHA